MTGGLPGVRAVVSRRAEAPFGSPVTGDARGTIRCLPPAKPLSPLFFSKDL